MPCEIQSELITSSHTTWIENAQVFLEYFSSIKELFSIVIFMLICLWFAVYIITRWQNHINKITQLKINKLKDTGKYIENIFIELNDSKELLRYFLHGQKWKLKIIHLYNSLFKLYIINTVKKNINNNINFSIPFYTSLISIRKQVEKARLFFETMRDKEGLNLFKEDTGDLDYYAWSMFFRYDKLLQKIISKISMFNTNYVLILGNAGNGKTNLLCNFSETVMKYRQPCIFIDAKEIKGNIEDFLIKTFNIPTFLGKKISPELFLKIYSSLLCIRKKYLFVVVDALNENDTKGFHDVIKIFFNKLGKYDKVKILVSCRSEYFNERFEKIFNEIDPQFTTIKINEEKYNARAKEKTLISYQRYFNVNGTIIDAAKEKLFASLLLMRIFFEVNKGKNVNALELRNAEIYKQYIKQISERYSEFTLEVDFQEILDRIARIMLKNNSYDGVLIRDLGLNNKKLEIFKTMLDENLIINKKIKEGAGITERENEIVYFVFDELRDFCISKNILINCEQQDKIDYKELFEFLNDLNKNKLSPLEGVLKYSYYNLKNNSANTNRLVYCEKILAKFGDAVKYDFHDSQNNIFSSFGILMVLADTTYLEKFELEYIAGSMKRPSDFWNLLNILLNNEFTKCGLTVKTFLDILLEYTIDSIRDIIKEMTIEKYYYRSFEKDELNYFCSKILHQDNISNEIKWILIFMNEIQKGNSKIEKCIYKFNIEEDEKKNFIAWLSANKYPDFHIDEISKLIGVRGDF